MTVTTRLFREDGKYVAFSTQDVEPYLENNAQLRSQSQKSDWCREIADIPNVILVKWLNDEYTRGNTALRMYTKEWTELVKRKLQDPEWKYLRTDK